MFPSLLSYIRYPCSRQEHISFLVCKHKPSKRIMSSKPWGEVILATFLVNLATLIGVITMLPGRKLVNKNVEEKVVENFLASTSAGALFATSFFMVLPESSMNLLLVEHTHEGRKAQEATIEYAVSYLFGLSVLVGFFLPTVLAVIFPHPEIHEGQAGCEVGTAVHNKDTKAVETETQGAIVVPDEENDSSRRIDNSVQCHSPTVLLTHFDWPPCCAVLFGNVFHNFGDGVFIGTAFLLCDSNVAISIAAATFYHELVHQLANFFILTNHGRLPKLMALFLNFLSGLFMVIGGVVALAVHTTTTMIGFILGVAGGVFIYISACECMPRALRCFECKTDRLLSILFFSLGAIPIGLLMLNHKHCEVEG
jgi:zinc transporter ZupT